MSYNDPEKVLNNILKGLQQYDPELFFLNPVSEKEAPGYYELIKNPMCINYMKNKIKEKAYKTWGEFREDFKLMCKNAITYNTKKTPVFRAAISMFEEGNRDLQKFELEGRKAMYMLHEKGPFQAFSDEKKEFMVRGSPAPTNPFSPLSVIPRKILNSNEKLHFPKENKYSYFEDSETESDDENMSRIDVESIGSLLKLAKSGIEWEACPKHQSNTKYIDIINKDIKTELRMDWQNDIRDIEWRCKWIRLRIKELEFMINKEIDSNDVKCPRKEIKESNVVTFDKWLSNEALKKHPFYGLQSNSIKFNSLKRNKKMYINNINDSCATKHAILDILESKIKSTIDILHDRRKVCNENLEPYVLNKQQHEKALQKKQKTMTMAICPEIKRLKFNSEAKEVWQEKINQMLNEKESLKNNTEKSAATDIKTPQIHKITEDEKRKWKKARLTWKPNLQSGSKRVTKDVEVLMRGLEDEGTSEEDISDINYTNLHDIMEKKEHEMNLNVFGSPTKNEDSKERFLVNNGKKASKRKIINTSDEEYQKNSEEDEEEVDHEMEMTEDSENNTFKPICIID